MLGYTTEEQRSVVRFCRQKDSMQTMCIKKCFLFMVGSVNRLKRFTTGSRSSLKIVRKSLMMPDQELKWLKQQVKYFYAASFNALVRRWDKCIIVCEGYVENCVLFEARISYVSRYTSNSAPFTDSSTYNDNQ
jgi:hypothetical protein